LALVTNPVQLSDPLCIVADRVTIRSVAEPDLADLQKINGDPEVTRFLPYATWQSHADAQAWLERMRRLSEEQGARQLVIVDNESQRVIGTLLVFKPDESSRCVEIGYVVGREHWRRGFASAALNALLDHLFSTAGLRRVEAQVNPANTASTCLLLSLGFVLEGHLRERYEGKGEIHGVDLYGLLAREWDQRMGPENVVNEDRAIEPRQRV